MIHFKGIENQTVKLSVASSQYPVRLGDDEDNWLQVKLNVKSHKGNWSVTDPMITYEDLKILKAWFKKLAENIIPLTEKLLHFLEPNLAFSILSASNEIKKIRIHFELYAVPKSLDGEEEYFVDCYLQNKELKKLVSEIAQEIKRLQDRKEKIKN